mgnify:CR=1|jgi:hypothetical protein
MSTFNVNLCHCSAVSPYNDMIVDDPVFDPSVHLALEMPAYTISMTDLGYDEEVRANTPTDIAATSCFRILSDEGVAAMYHVCQQLEAFTTSNPRVARNTRGGIYRSNFLRDFSCSPEVAAHHSQIMKTELTPLALGHNLAHVNYPPLELGKNIDKWHVDTLQVDTVMFVTDPNQVEGGEFQYFKGTKEDIANLRDLEQPIPTHKIITPPIKGAGYAVLQQGNYVVHQASALRTAGERITLVNGYSYADMAYPDYTAVGQLIHADPEEVVGAEYCHHMALRIGRQLQAFTNQPNFQLSLQAQAESLRKVQTELQLAIEQLDNARGQAMHHFGD